MLEGLLDVGRTARESPAHARVDAGKVGPGTLEPAPGDTQPTRELGTQLRFVEVASGTQFEEQPTGVECRPTTVRPRRQVRDKHVTVKVRIRRAAGSVEKRRCDQAAGRERRRCLATCEGAPDAGATALQVAERSLGRFLVAGTHVRSNLLGTERMQHAHRLRGRVRAVEGGDANPVVVRREHLARSGVDTGEQRMQRRAVHRPHQAEARRCLPKPEPFGLDESTGVLPAGGHCFQVVPLPAPSQLGDTQHRPWLRAVPTARPTASDATSTGCSGPRLDGQPSRPRRRGPAGRSPLPSVRAAGAGGRTSLPHR